MGCAECYYTFAKEFRDTLASYGINEAYKGTLPKRIKGYRSKLVDRMTMQIKLEEAVAAEEYEKAALYRDYLKVLNHGTETKDGQQ
jgi:protein arginine kinase activator